MSKYVIALVIALSLNAAANLLIKFGMRAIDLEVSSGASMDGVLGILRMVLRHWIVLVGLFCFAANVVFWAYALQKLPISAAYPVMVASGFAIIVVVAGQLLHERLTLGQWLGVAAILLGVVLVAKDAGRQMGSPASQPGGPAQMRGQS